MTSHDTMGVFMLPYAELLDLPLGERVKYVREALGLTQDEFAKLVGASSGRQAVIRWEKGSSEPKHFAANIARVTPYPAEAFRRHGTEGISLETIDLRLRAIEARLAGLAGQDDVERGFETLRTAIDRLARSRTREAGRAQKDSVA